MDILPRTDQEAEEILDPRHLWTSVVMVVVLVVVLLFSIEGSRSAILTVLERMCDGLSHIALS